MTKVKGIFQQIVNNIKGKAIIVDSKLKPMMYDVLGIDSNAVPLTEKQEKEIMKIIGGYQKELRRDVSSD